VNSLRAAWRSLARSPGFAVIAVLALGLGLGLSTTMFAVLDAVVNPYMPYRDPDHLFTVRWWYSVRDVTIPPGALYSATKNETSSFESVVPYGGGQKQLETADDYRDVSTALVPPEFFAVTGVRPRLGRAFTAGDGEDLVVLSDGLFRRVFGRRRSIQGAKVTLSSRTYTVVGVMPRASVVPGYAEVWVPLTQSTGGRDFQPLVRLKPGVTKEQANADLQRVSIALTARYAKPDRPIHFELADVRERSEQLRDIHKAMVGAALCVLIIACVNLAHLMLARGLAKRRELALRMALGASRAVVVRQMFMECAIITAAGAALGALGAVWGAEILTNRMPPQLAWVGVVEPQLSWRVFALSALAAVASAVLFGLVPAIRVAFMVSLDEPLKDGAGTTGRSRQRYSPLVMAEVGLALVLMMGGGLLLRTIQQLRKVEFTYDTRRLLHAVYGVRRDQDSNATIHRDAVLNEVVSVRGVTSAGFEGRRLLIGGAITAEMVVGDSTRTLNERSYSAVSWQYLRVLGVPILKGRGFEPGDSMVAIVDPVAAERLYPRQDPVGRMIKLGAPARDAPWIRIVGVVRTPMAIRGRSDAPVDPMVWVVVVNHPAQFGSLVVRTASESPRVLVDLRRKLHTLPGLWYAYVGRANEDRDRELAARAFLAKVFVTMGTVALALSVLGLYGVLAYAVGQRTREFAVRIALGAEPRQLFRMVMHDGMVMVLAGIGVGAFGALAAARLLDAVLADVLPSDVVSLIACEAVLLVAGLAASLGPARRAVRASPLEILRAV
jgi:predicted permease